MIKDRNIDPNADIQASKIAGLLNAQKTYYVDRNVGASGVGTSWSTALKTFGEAITLVNADYAAGTALPDKGRNRCIVVSEGWFSEVGTTLTASDVTIISTASGSRISDGTVLYGSATAGGWDAGAVVPMLTITGSAISFINMGFMNSASGLYPCISVGQSGSSGPTDVAFYNCFFPRDAADAYTYAIVDYSNEGGRYEGCSFGQSAKTAGILVASNGVTNPVNTRIKDCTFVGIPTGVSQTAGHNTIVSHCLFLDSTDDRADTCDTPIVAAATSLISFENYAQGVNAADVATGSGIKLEANNYGDDT